MLQQAFFGPLREPAYADENVGDMNGRESLAIAPICAMCLFLGVMPQPALDLIRPDVEAVVSLYELGRQNLEAQARVASDAAKSIVETTHQETLN
jgi:NADH:ubiquinone oxidoreductase subunit 4 (subunit M)